MRGKLFSLCSNGWFFSCLLGGIHGCPLLYLGNGPLVLGVPKRLPERLLSAEA
jgi:hypothetical protein